jgi:hypothetical protein
MAGKDEIISAGGGAAPHFGVEGPVIVPGWVLRTQTVAAQ